MFSTIARSHLDFCKDCFLQLQEPIWILVKIIVYSCENPFGFLSFFATTCGFSFIYIFHIFLLWKSTWFLATLQEPIWILVKIIVHSCENLFGFLSMVARIYLDSYKDYCGQLRESIWILVFFATTCGFSFIYIFHIFLLWKSTWFLATLLTRIFAGKDFISYSH